MAERYTLQEHAYSDDQQYLDEEITDDSPYSESVSAIAFDFDQVTGAPDKSRADEIRLLSVKNKKQPKNSKEKKPPGRGWPTGGVEGGFYASGRESFEQAVRRETLGESGYTVTNVLGELFCEPRHHIRNNVRVFLAEADSTYVVPVRERDEVDANYDNWVTLREVFKIPYAIAKDGTPRDPNGFYYAHVRRLVKALNILTFADPEIYPELREDIEKLPRKIVDWVEDHHDQLTSAFIDLVEDGLVFSNNGLIELIKRDN